MDKTAEKPEVICPACNTHTLKDGAWLPCSGGHYQDKDYYDCANCGPVQKDYVNEVIKRRAEAVEEVTSLLRLGVLMVSNSRADEVSAGVRQWSKRVMEVLNEGTPT